MQRPTIPKNAFLNSLDFSALASMHWYRGDPMTSAPGPDQHRLRDFKG